TPSLLSSFLLLLLPSPSPTLFPYTTLFRSIETWLLLIFICGNSLFHHTNNGSLSGESVQHEKRKPMLTFFFFYMILRPIYFSASAANFCFIYCLISSCKSARFHAKSIVACTKPNLSPISYLFPVKLYASTVSSSFSFFKPSVSWISPPFPADRLPKMGKIVGLSTYLPMIAKFDGAWAMDGFSINVSIFWVGESPAAFGATMPYLDTSSSGTRWTPITEDRCLPYA